MKGKPSIESISTIGLPKYFINCKLSDGSLANVEILDTAGQERFKSINTSYYRDADCCLLVYDITERKTFDEIKNYFIEAIEDKCKKNIQIILLGNKTDLENKRQVQSIEGANLAHNNNYMFMETSCLKNSNVADAFQTLIEITNRDLMENKIENKKDDNRITLNELDDKDSNKKKSCSC